MFFNTDDVNITAMLFELVVSFDFRSSHCIVFV